MEIVKDKRMGEGKVIGGEFEIEVKARYEERTAVPDGAVTYASGRTALFNILAQLKAQRGIKCVLFPDWLCESVYRMAERNGLGMEFYALDRQLEPEWKDLESRYERGKAVLLINYFGMQDSRSLVARLKGIDAAMPVVLDNVQAPYEMLRGTEADYAFSSFRKAFPVADGSWATAKRGGLPQPERKNGFAQWKVAGSCLKAMRDPQLFSDEVYLDLFRRGEEAIDADYGCDMSALAKAILSDLEWQPVADRRRANAAVLIEGLSRLGISPLLPLGEDAVPLFVPIRLADRDRVRKAMFAERIFLPVHWPVEEGYEGRLATGGEMAAHELSLIVDQRYDEGDMERILRVLESNI